MPPSAILYNDLYYHTWSTPGPGPRAAIYVVSGDVVPASSKDMSRMSSADDAAAERAANDSWAARDLRFVHRDHDGTAPPPSLLLTREELAAYARDGFVLPAQPLLARAEAQWHGDLWQALFDEHGTEGNGFSINGFFKRFGGCWDLVAHPNVVQLARDTLGTAHVACWGAHYVCKLPHHEAEEAFHQDGVLWPFSATRNCSIWLALDDVDESNGCTEFFAGSHLLGGLHRLRREGDDGIIQPDALARLRTECGPLVPARLAAGFASVHSDLTAHLAMGPNQLRPCLLPSASVGPASG